jgi:hypothetical protein
MDKTHYSRKLWNIAKKKKKKKEKRKEKWIGMFVGTKILSYHIIINLLLRYKCYIVAPYCVK